MEQTIYTVSQLNAITRLLLEENFPLIWVTGEISNLVQAQSGHFYFSLKDERAQVRCAMFRSKNNMLNFVPTNGRQILIKAQCSIYEQRGDYQLIVQYMEEISEGILRRKFEELKKKLQSEGLFALEHKRELPKSPKCVGVITSPIGAAIHDIISVLKRRSIITPVIIYPTQVQGNEAVEQIVAAIQIANKRAECEVLILARGGGSLEDLWPFNEESVARAIFASNIPIVSGIGHEVDITITDLVADKRAPTPSVAAELISTDSQEELTCLENLVAKILHLFRSKLKYTKLVVDNLVKRIPHPAKRLQTYVQCSDDLEQRLHLAMRNWLKHQKNNLSNLGRALEALSPLATLNRGYAIVTKDAKVLYDINEIEIGGTVTARLKNGILKCKVEEKNL
jgi:exodeoxyribonuclease VII large subunit